MVGLAGMLSAGPAGAQHSASEAVTSQPVNFSIPAQPLSSAINAFIRATGWQISYSSQLVHGKTSVAVIGVMPPSAALERLVAGTGLSVRIGGSGSAALVGSANASGATVAGAISLDTIDVQGDAGGLPPVYAGGQVASGGRVGILGNRSIMNTPFSQTNFTSKTIQDQNARSIADVVENDPSVRNVWPAGSGIDQFSMRGFLTPNQDVAFNGLFGISPSASNVVSLEGIERVEILKGPSALLSGMAPGGATGGQINLVPKRAIDDSITRLTTGYSSVAQLGTNVDVGRRFGEAKEFGVRFNGAYRNGEVAVDSNRIETGVATLGLDYRGERLRVGVDLGYQNNDFNRPIRPIRLAPGLAVPSAPNPSTNFQPPWTFAKMQDIYGAIRGEYDLTSNVTIFGAIGHKRATSTVLSAFQTIINARGDMLTAVGSPFYAGAARDDTAAETGIRAKFDTGPVKHEVMFAFNGFWEDSNYRNNVLPIVRNNFYEPFFGPAPSLVGLSTDPIPLSQTKLTSFALADILSILDDRMQLTLGLRRQNVDVTNYSQTTGIGATASVSSVYNQVAYTPAVGVVVKPMENVSLYANYIEALASGAVAPPSAVNRGEVFAPYRTKQLETGVKVDWGRFTTTASVFQISQPSGITDPIANVFSVVGEQRNRGAEFNVFGEPLDGMRVLGGVMFLEGTMTKTAGGLANGRTAIGVPEVNLNLGAEWDVPYWPGATLTSRLIHTSSQFLDVANTQQIPSWTRFDLGARYVTQLVGRPLTVRANVLNVSNNHYWASTIGGQLIQGTPRTYLLSATIDF
jgi:iron complex outermembrane receptor protein